MNFNDRKKEERESILVQPAKSHCEFPGKPEEKHKTKWLHLIAFGAGILILELFFIYISTYINSEVLRGVAIMACALFMRICMDFSIRKKGKFPIDGELEHYKQQLHTYYETRKYMHFIVAPLLLVAYIYGFSMLLSIFEQELFGGFYTYIIFSSWTIFLGLNILIGVQLRAELEILKSLIAGDKNL